MTVDDSYNEIIRSRGRIVAEWKGSKHIYPWQSIARVAKDDPTDTWVVYELQLMNSTLLCSSVRDMKERLNVVFATDPPYKMTVEYVRVDTEVYEEVDLSQEFS